MVAEKSHWIKQKILFILFLIILSTNPISASTDISSCEVALNTDGETYSLLYDLESTGNCLTAGANNITIDGRGRTINFANTTTGIGINNTGYNGVTVTNITVNQFNQSVNTAYGVQYKNTIGGSINNVTVNVYNTTSIGIYVLSASDLTVSDNRVVNSTRGIELQLSSNITATNNTAYSATGVGLYLYSLSNSLISHNTGASNIQTGIYLWQSSNNLLSDNTGSSNTSIGLYSVSSTGNTLFNNTFTSRTNAALWLYTSSNNNTLINNTATSGNATGGNAGIAIESSNNNTLINNTGSSIATPTGSGRYGIYLFIAENNTLSSNIATSSVNIGLYLYNAGNNTFINNTATSNAKSGTSVPGIYLYTNHTYQGYASNNVFINNIATSNNSSRGIMMYGTRFNTVSNNIFISNTFRTTSTSATLGDLAFRNISATNIFIETNFSIPRKINLITLAGDTLPQYNMSQDNISFILTSPTLVSTSLTTNRSVLNWNRDNITLSETWTAATGGMYSASGLYPNARYYIYNGSSLKDTLFTNSSGALSSFTVNFSTSSQTISLILDPSTPPTPVLGAITTGNFWINTGWSAGTGNITDSYNVSYNGAWINGSSAISKNTTLPPHGWHNVTVYAWNNSGGGLSVASISNNTQIPNNPIYLVNVSNNYNVLIGTVLEINPLTSDVDLDVPIFSSNNTKGSFNNSTGILTWTPTTADAGVYVWNISANDGQGNSVEFITNITVTQPPNPSSTIRHGARDSYSGSSGTSTSSTSQNTVSSTTKSNTGDSLITPIIIAPIIVKDKLSGIISTIVPPTVTTTLSESLAHFKESVLGIPGGLWDYITSLFSNTKSAQLIPSNDEIIPSENRGLPKQTTFILNPATLIIIAILILGIISYLRKRPI